MYHVQESWCIISALRFTYFTSLPLAVMNMPARLQECLQSVLTLVAVFQSNIEWANHRKVRRRRTATDFTTTNKDTTRFELMLAKIGHTRIKKEPSQYVGILIQSAGKVSRGESDCIESIAVSDLFGINLGKPC